jgi:hypothetical protein
MHRINHQEAYSLDGDIYTNNAESFFSRMRRAEIGHHHHLKRMYLLRAVDHEGEILDVLVHRNQVRTRLLAGGGSHKRTRLWTRIPC